MSKHYGISLALSMCTEFILIPKFSKPSFGCITNFVVNWAFFGFAIGFTKYDIQTINMEKN